MNYSVQTIPQLLIETRDNRSIAAKRIGVQRNTIRKYAEDFDGKYHAIVNGRLMIYHGGKRPRSKVCEDG